MKSNHVSRRRFIAGAGRRVRRGRKRPSGSVAHPPPQKSEQKVPFTYCLNTSTIRGQNLSLDKEIEIAADAGYTGIEPWVAKVSDYAGNGGKPKGHSQAAQRFGHDRRERHRLFSVDSG